MKSPSGMHCKDIADTPILRVLAKRPKEWHFRFEIEPSILHAFPGNCPEKLVLAKMQRLIARGLADGCTCGCRGDFQITDKGIAYLNAVRVPE